MHNPLPKVHAAEVRVGRWPRPQWVLVGWLLLLGLIGRVGNLMDAAAYHARPPWVFALGVTAIVAAFAVLALIMLRKWRPRVLLGLLAIIVYGSYPILGVDLWGPLPGLLGAAFLLTLSAPISWVLAALAVIAELVLYHWAAAPPCWLLGIMLIIEINMTVAYFAPVYLVRRLDEMDREREWLAAHAVAAERRDTTTRLSRTLGADLMSILRAIRETQEAPSRSGLERIAELSRAALGGARSIADAQRVDPPLSPRDESARLSSHMALWFFIIVLVDHSALVLFNVATYSISYPPIWLLCALVAASGALQLYHGAPRPGGSTPRAWRWTLPVHLVLAVSMAFMPVQPSPALLTPPAVLALGACVVRMRSVWAWAVPALATVLFPLALPAASSVGEILYWCSVPSMSAILVYSLCRIPPVARQLAQTRAQAARMAVVTERLRVARDVHDLLGRALVGITLEAELAARLLERDPDAADAEMAELALLADSALSELRAIPDGVHRASFTEELTSARSVLEAAGSQVTVEHSPAPTAHDQLLAVVLREAVTNVVRHSRAERTSILLTAGDYGTRLHITNDHPSPACDAERAGTGLTNLTTRLTSVGGHLTANRGPTTFTLMVTLPVDQSQPASCAI